MHRMEIVQIYKKMILKNSATLYETSGKNRSD